MGPTTYDITNYVPEIDFEIPRDNQASSGSATVANPNGINDDLKKYTDKEIRIEVGLKTRTGQYEFQEFDRFWIKKTEHELEGKVNRLHLTFTNILDRLDNPFRDVYNFVGNIDWNDFSTGKRNQAFNYFFASDTNPKVNTDHHLVTSGIVLFTGWKGQNSDVSAHFTGVSTKVGLIARYKDSKNYIYLTLNGSTLELHEVYQGRQHDGRYLGSELGREPYASTHHAILLLPCLPERYGVRQRVQPAS
jgi:hypothetical protein